MGRKFCLLKDKLKNREEYGRIGGGSVAEWLKAHDSKSCGRVTVSEVRILSLPPETKEESLLSYFVSEGSTEDKYPLASAIFLFFMFFMEGFEKIAVGREAIFASNWVFKNMRP